MNEFGNFLKEIREQKELSVRKASEKIGISHTYLDSLEKGFDPRTKKERKPTPEVLKKLSKGLGIDYNALMYGAGYISDHEAGNRWIEETRRSKLIRKIKGWFHE